LGLSSSLSGSLLLSGSRLSLSGGGLSRSSLGGGSLSLSGGSLSGDSLYFGLLSGGSSLVSFLLVLGFFLVLGGLLLSVLFEDLLVISDGLLGSLPSGLLVSLVDSLSSESSVSDESLDLGSLISDGLAFLFDLSSDNESSDIIILGEGEELSDSGGSLGSESLGELGVSETSNGLFTDLDDSEGNNGEISTDDATSDGLSLSFTSSSGSVALVASLHEDSDSSLDEDTLLHGETVLIVTTGNFEDVSLEFVTKNVTFDFLTHSSTVEDGKLLFIVNSDGLLAASGRAGDVKFHA